ncbi:glycosyltransferase family 2 protein [Mucilaginibacter sp. JRF]|uniref:glycosyltransferase family 2 protein n=1 Tax=Mucilaginibacter sp. JRF TaxID=2780088 RepID=UPI001880F6F0|nr:glycosyltransferase family A protein [Mucilaginibacter sp. JRF]MBE9585877.1 glycosyltransferase family 2 protein [Mucilaginibacter sp. JRF]
MVSVIIPCYNCEGFIDRALQSVFAQTYKDLEVILVDNMSTDNTWAKLNSYQILHPELITVYQEPKKGAPAARNNGLEKARGEWIQFLDADDELLPEKIAHQLKVAAEQKADVIAGDCVLKYHNNGDGYTIVRKADKNIWRGLIGSQLGITSSNLWRKDALLAVNGWDEKALSSQEYDLLFRLLKSKATIAVDNSKNTYVHFADNSVSKSTDQEKRQRILNARIDLRLKIKTELNYRNLLTTELRRAIDKYIYLEIMRNYNAMPAYANGLLQQHKLDVSFVQVLQTRAKLFLKGLKKSILQSA